MDGFSQVFRDALEDVSRDVKTIVEAIISKYLEREISERYGGG